jgi:DNA-binding MarR family transcriptional regulator
MGSQDEYLRNFTVLLTEKGVVPLTDPAQIAVCKCLESGMKRPSDIAAEMNIPSSSLHFILDKMVESGIVVRSKPDPEKKSVYYSNLAIKIVGSAEPSESSKSVSEDAFGQPTRYYDGMSAVGNMFESYTNEIGLDMTYIRAKYASDLADACADEIGRGNMEEAIIQVRSVFARLTGFKFSVFSLSPLTVVFEGDRCMSAKLDMLSAFVCRAVENATGKYHRVTATEDFSSGDVTRFKVTMERSERVDAPYMNTSLPKSSDVDQFLIVDLDGSAGLMTSKVQLETIEAIYERPLIVTDIVNRVDAPRSTVTNNLIRMVEEGLISVFYSESGAAYYGLACSLLMKKVAHPKNDRSWIDRIMYEVSSKDGAFMEGYLRYAVSMLQGLGFNTDYMMVVLGAKLVRETGRDQPRSFDQFFGRMSGFANTMGLSMSIVSVYPLTIGISMESEGEECESAVTFVKGMAHQGLEIASDGIFVRNMEEDGDGRKISFKEIYPSLSMTPVEGIITDPTAVQAASKSKRTSSVKVALFNRSAKSGSQTRTVRYITGFVAVVMVAAIMLFAFTANSGTDAESFSVEVDDSIAEIVFYDDGDNVVEIPTEVIDGTEVIFYIPDGSEIGYTAGGLSYHLERGDDGKFRVKVKSDMKLDTVYEVADIEGCQLFVFNFDKDRSEKFAYLYTGYYSLSEYEDLTGGKWIGSDAMVKISSDEGKYISTSEDDPVLWSVMVVNDPTLSGISAKDMPSDYVNVTFRGDYSYKGKYLTGTVKVLEDRTMNVMVMSPSSGMTMAVSYGDGPDGNLSMNEDSMFVFNTGSEDCEIDQRKGDFI